MFLFLNSDFSIIGKTSRFGNDYLADNKGNKIRKKG
jgi:hypothetical protein